MLVGLGCDVGHADNEGNTVWLAAAQSHNVDLLRKLLDHGCNLHDSNKAGCTAEQAALCLPMLQRPEGDAGRAERIWSKHVLPLKDAYQMNP